MKQATYPIRLHLRDRTVLVVGGGRVATRKVERLVATGARTHVVCLAASARITELCGGGSLELSLRRADEGDVDGAFLVVVATDDANVNTRMSQAARAAGALLLRADAPEQGDFSVPAQAQSAWLEATISTRGRAPAASRRLRRELKAWMKRGPDRFAAELAALRDRLAGRDGAMQVLREVADGELFSACARGDEAAISRALSHGGGA